MEPKKPNGTNKSYGIIIISDYDIEVDDDSDKYEDLTTSKEDQNMLRKDSEDEFLFNCNHCELDTIFEDQLKYHIEWKQKRQKRSHKRKSDYSLLQKRRPSPSLNQIKQIEHD